MAVVYLLFVALICFAIASVIAVFTAFVLRKVEKFNIRYMASITAVVIYLLFLCFHLWNLSHYDHLLSGGSLKVSEGSITLSGYFTTAWINLIFAFIGGLVGLIWYFILNRLSKAPDA